MNPAFLVSNSVDVFEWGHSWSENEWAACTSAIWMAGWGFDGVHDCSSWEDDWMTSSSWGEW